MGPIDEISGYYANLNHPYIEVEDTALAMIRFRSGALGSVVVSLSQKPGLYTKIHVHGANGASVGAETDSGATFIAGMTAVAAPPLNDLWTIPGEEALLPAFQEEDRTMFGRIDPNTHYHVAQDRDFLRAVLEDRPPLTTGEDGRKYRLVYGTRNSHGVARYYKYYLDEGKLPEDWWADINSLQASSAERTGYPTQKPEALLRRIVEACSRPGDTVLDAYCGCGTTLVAAERSGRAWIGIDLAPRAVALTLERLKTTFGSEVTERIALIGP